MVVINASITSFEPLLYLVQIHLTQYIIDVVIDVLRCTVDFLVGSVDILSVTIKTPSSISMF